MSSRTSILCGTDLSEASIGTLDVALGVAKLRGDREVVLVHVADEGTPDRDLADTRQRLDAQVASRSGAGNQVSIRAELIVGTTDETLVQFADTESADLIVIAARSRSDGDRLGSTANQIITRTHIPVIVVRDPAPWLAFARDERPLRLMVGMDDSAVCELGIQWIHRLRTQGAVEVVLGAIYYPDDAADHFGLDRKSMVDRDPEVERMMARGMLRRFGATDGVVARARRGLGRIGDHMIELATEENVDAILVGTGQKTGLGRLGSVSSVIVENAPQSVICVPPQADIPTVTVPVLRAALVATDLSQFSNRAIPYAFAACEPDAEIHLVHIIDDDSDVDVEEIRRTLLALPPQGAKQKTSAHVVRGDNAAETIAQTAARLGVDLICICSHGRSGITRALVGSVADRLLRETRLPVLVLRPT